MLKTDHMTQTAPTIHPHSEELKLGNIKFNTYDLGGHETARKIWKEYFPVIDGIIFLVDAADPSRFPEAKNELQNLLDSPELGEIPICILGNKVDKFSAVREEVLREELDLNSLIIKETRPFELYMCSVIKRMGYDKAFLWISEYLK